MTGTADSRTAARSAPRPLTSLGRALGLEWQHHRGRILLYALLAAVIVLVAILAELRLGVVAILLAARLPADLADASEDGRYQRSALGISRADAVRARTLMICGGQLVLALGAVGAICLTQWLPDARHWSSFDIRSTELGPLQMTWWDHLVDIGLWSGAILWTHALVGGRAIQLGERPSRIGALAQFIGISLLAWLMVAGSTLLASVVLMNLESDAAAALGAAGTTRFVVAARVGQSLTLVLTFGGGVLALLLAQRRWVRRA